MGGQGWGSLVPPAVKYTPGKGWTFLLMEEGGAFASRKGRRISLAWCVLLQKGGFSSKGKGNETEKCFLLSKRDGEPCVIVLSAGAARSAFASSARREPSDGGRAERHGDPLLPCGSGPGTATSSPTDGRQCLGRGQLDALHTDPCASLGRSCGEMGMSQPKVETEMGLRSCWRAFGQCPQPVLTAGTWAVPAHPLALPGSREQPQQRSQTQQAPLAHGTAVVLHQGMFFPFAFRFFFKAQTDLAFFFVASRKNNINSGAFPSNSSSEKLIISTGAAFNQHQSL